jgi:hypothetical protein
MLLQPDYDFSAGVSAVHRFDVSVADSTARLTLLFIAD